MALYREHAITQASFAQIDREFGDRREWSESEYAVVRRAIHTTADFEFKHLLRFHHHPFNAVMAAACRGETLVTDVSMVAAGIRTVVAQTWQLPVQVALEQLGRGLSEREGHAPRAMAETGVAGDTPAASVAKHLGQMHSGQTRSAQAIRHCAQMYPQAIFVIGNAPTALLALCDGIQQGACRPSLVIGAPVGFINVLEAKQALSMLSVPHILVEGRKGGSAVAAAILNALLIWAWEQSPS